MAPQALPKSAYLSDVWKDGIFANKVVFCTGGAGTICSAQVRALVHLGANACIVGRNEEKTVEAAASIATARPGAKVLGLGGCDVRLYDSVAKAVERCVAELGGVDFVIAGAAGNFLAPIHGLSSNAFARVLEIDAQGSYNTLKATTPYLRASASKHRVSSEKEAPVSTGGRIIFVSATLHYTGTPLQAHVAAAKAAVDALARVAAIEMGPLGITSNCIAPGPIADTEGMGRLATAEGYAKAARGVPVQRMGSVRDVADATVYLFGGTGGFVNGEVLVVDGGQWHMGNLGAGGAGGDFKYPDFLLSEQEVTGVAGGKKKKGSKI